MTVALTPRLGQPKTAQALADLRLGVRATSTTMGSFTQRYVKRHGSAQKALKSAVYAGFSFPDLNLRFQDDVWRWNADRITAAFDLEYMAKKHLDGMDMDNTKSDPGSWQDVVDRTLQ